MKTINYSTRQLLMEANLLTKNIILFSVLIISMAYGNRLNAQISLTATVGTTDPSSYSTLKAAFDKINDGTHQGIISIEISANISESATAVLYQSGYNSTSNYSTVTIYPTASGLSITGNLATPLIDLNGADNVTIDGRVNATGSSKDLVITNTSTSNTAGTSTIRFINDATSNIVKYCGVKGSSMATTGGIIYFATTTASIGNDNNTLDNNNITNATDASRPLNVVYSLGTASKLNSGNTISNNNIYNFLNRGSASNGIYLVDYNTDWTISGNSFYEIASFVPTATVAYTVINVSYTSGIGNNFSIVNNYIGGNEAGGVGTWAKTAAFDNSFTGIYLKVATGTASNIQGNTIGSMSYANSSTGSFNGINIVTGDVNIGTTTANAISGITYTAGATNGNFYGVNISSTGAINCQNNVISGITAANSNSAYATNFYGINKTNVAGNTTISNNTIGSTSTANSINAGSTSTGNTQSVYGISCAGTSTNTISGNTIANLTNASANTTTSTVGQIYGISSTSGTNTISNNTVRDLTISNNYTSGSAAIGISQSSTTAAAQTVSGNTIYNINNNYASFSGSVVGLYYNGPTTASIVNRNFIYGVSASGVSTTAASLYGIRIAAGATTYFNNIISLGGNSTSTLYGIYETGASSNNNNLYFNTVYLSGSPSAGALNSYCLYSAVTANFRDFRNNIFNNARSNNGATGKHYAMYIPTAGGTLTCNFNDYYTSGTGGVIGFYGAEKTTLPIVSGVTGNDNNSKNILPVFILPEGTNASDFVPSETSLNGSTISTVSTDYTNASRTYQSMGAFDYSVNDIIVLTATSGTATAKYSTLKEAFDAINAGTHKGDISIAIQSNVSEYATATLYQSGYNSTSNYSTVSVYPSITGLSITGNLATPLIDLNGADNVTIDGRVNATGSSNDLVISNTSTSNTAGTSTIRFINDATSNIIQYCNIKGSSSSTTDGILSFSTTSGAGNSGNLIEHNNITCAADANRPINGVYSSGTASKQNSNNIVSNNYFYNFFNRAANSNGINLFNNNTAWTISGNSFFETSTFVPVNSTANYVVINITYSGANEYGTSFIVQNNTIGGNAADGSGTWWKSSTYNNIFSAMYLRAGTGSPSSVQGNTISNFSIANSGTAYMYGLNIAGGDFNIGTSIGNTISGITYTSGASGGIFYGINITSTGIVDCQNNVISGITAANSNSAYATNFYGINKTNVAGNITISNNTIGSTSTANSINASSTSNGNTQSVYAISCAGTSTNTISGNTIANLTNASANPTTTSVGQIYGISSTSGTNTISNNTVRDLTISNNYTSGSAATGISQSSTTAAAQTVSGNTIYNISNNNSSFAGSVVGLYYDGPATASEVSKNFIHDLNLSSSNVSATLYGIRINNGLTKFSNNIVSLGKNLSTGYNIYNIYDGSNSTTSVNEFYFNTLYIEGSVSNGTQTANLYLNSYNYSPYYPNNRKIQNNILCNSRTNSAGTAIHYNIYTLYGTFFSTDHNVYYANGTGGKLAYLGGTAVTTLPVLAAQDAGSSIANPGFANPGGSIINSYEPSNLLLGQNITGITTDINNNTRQIPEIGAIEKALTTIDGTISANQGYCSPTQPNDIVLSGQTYTSLQWQSSTDGVNFSNITGQTGTTLSGTDIGVLNSTTYFRVAITNGSTLTNYSNISTVFIGLSVSASNLSQSVLLNSSVSPLSVSAQGFPALSYQWYSNTTASNIGGTLVPAATNATFTPDNTAASNLYYYCAVTNSCSTVNSPVSGKISINPKVTITSVSPSRADAGSTIIITGTNFNSTASNNTVYISDVIATVTSATATQLQVTVPYGSKDVPVRVVNTESGLSAESAVHFILSSSPINICEANFTKRTFATSGIPSGYYADVDAADFNNDGRLDMVTHSDATYTPCEMMNFYVNNSTQGGNVSFLAAQQITINTRSEHFAVEDINNDGKMDVLVIGVDNDGVTKPKLTAMINTTPDLATSLSFDKYEFDVRTNSYSNMYMYKLMCKDMDGDGKPDAVFDTYSSNANGSVPILYVMLNKSSQDNIKFDFANEFSSVSNMGVFDIADFNNDGLNDVVYNTQYYASNTNGYLLINQSTTGNLNFNSPITLNGAAPFWSIKATDFDNDGKMDYVSTNPYSGILYTNRNNFSGGSISASSFGTLTNIGYSGNVIGVTTGDINNDGFMDIIATDYSNYSYFRIYQSLGTNTAGSFTASDITYDGRAYSGERQQQVSAFDLNNDGKMEIVGKQMGSITVMENNCFTEESGFILTQQPSTTITGTGTFAQQPILQLKDGSGNNITKSGISVTASIFSGNGTLSGTVSKSTDATGKATFTDLGLGCMTGSNVVLAFTSGGCTGTILSDTIKMTSVNMSGTIQVGSAQASPYNTLPNALNAYRFATLSGPVTFELIDEVYNLSNTTAFIYKNTQASATNTLTIQAASGVTPTITSSSSTGVIRINGADYITINGGISNDISMVNTNATPYGIYIDSLTTGCITDGSHHITIKNCNFTGNSTTAGSGIYINGNGMINLDIENNNFAKFGFGINQTGGNNTSASNNVYKNNIIGSEISSDYVGVCGIYISYLNMAEISGNVIKNIKSTSSTNNGPTGIYLYYAKNINVFNNFISGVEYTSTSNYGGKGLSLISNDLLNVFNNVIANIGGKGSSTITNGISGIYSSSTNSNFYFNTIALSGNYNSYATTNICAAIFNAGNGCNFVNNILFNKIQPTTNSTAKSYSFYSSVTGANIGTCDYNLYFGNTSNYVLAYVSADKTTLSALQTATVDDAHSINSDPLFSNESAITTEDFKLTSLKSGNPISGITTDYFGITRNVSNPNIGACEALGISVPTLAVTASATSITTSTATSGGNVTSDGGASVTARGVCWSNSQNPTIADSKTTDGTGIGAFSSSIEGLTAVTTYYVRAYATNSVGTAYGAQVSFTTLGSVPTLAATTSATSITSTSATSGGNITSDGGASVTARGVCWSSSQNPTIADSKTSDGTGTGSFTSSLTGLSAGTLYYVRAYATNIIGTAYGTQVSFLYSNADITNSQIINPENADIVVSTGNTFNCNGDNQNYHSITILPGGKLTLADTKTLSAGTLILKNDATGAGTFIDNNSGATPPEITATVNQYLTSGRNWYVSSPIVNASMGALSTAGSIVYYNEPTAAWVTVSSGSLNPMKGYISVSTVSTGNISFTGTLNNGNQTINLTRTSGVYKEGFNLVGNPYPSYVNWDDALKTNLEPTIWLRTKNASAYVFDTYNSFSGIGTNNNNNGALTKYIPPMQAFWVRVLKDQSTGSLSLTNAMRSHANVTSNILKSPKIDNTSNQSVVRLQVTNGTNSDEAILLFNPNASNGYDTYDSPKMTNANVAIPEIYTLAGTEQLVINGMSSINYDTELPIGFTTGQSNQFKISVIETSNLASDIQIILRDKVLGNELDLTTASYSFFSNPYSGTGRFVLLFKTPSITTDLKQNQSASIIHIYENADGQLILKYNGLIGNHQQAYVYNALGEIMTIQDVNADITELGNFMPGVYFVKVAGNEGFISRKIVVE